MYKLYIFPVAFFYICKSVIFGTVMSFLLALSVKASLYVRKIVYICTPILNYQFSILNSHP